MTKIPPEHPHVPLSVLALSPLTEGKTTVKLTAFDFFEGQKT